MTAPAAISGATAREIAASAESAVRDGVLAPGDALPTVRALAGELGTSPATVNSAYRILRQRGLVIGDGRRGTHVAPRPPVRLRDAPPAHEDEPAPARGDLSLGFPDPALLPPIGPALARLDLDRTFQIRGLDGNDPDLLALAAGSFAADGVPAGSIGVVAGALDGIERVLNAHLRPGDRVLLEDPAYPPARDLLTALGLVAVPAPVDDRGLIPDEVERCLARGVDAILAVPRAQNPFGSALDEARAGELRALIAARPDVLVIEDDHAGAVAGARFTSLIPDSWPRWAVVRSVSKVLHPDMRVAFVAGDATTVARVEGRQWLGPRWVSHILQGTVAGLLGDRGFAAMARQARERYAARRAALIEALAEHGITGHGRSGLNVWVPVPEEAPVVRAVLAAGWLVMAGERCRLNTAPAIRVTIATLQEEDAPEVAAAIASATHSRGPRRAY